jgi:hypothetical protein
MAVHLPERPYSAEQLSELAEACEVFERILPYFDVLFEHRPNPLIPESNDNVVNDSGSNRDKIKSATTGKSLSVSQIESQTGLTKRKIWGVLSAPDLVFKKTMIGKETHYQFDKTIPRANPIPRKTHEAQSSK